MSNGGLINKFGLIIFGLIIIGPLFFLINLLYDLADSDEKQLHALANDELIHEMSLFLSDLSPALYIENAMRDADIHFGLRKENILARTLIPAKSKEENYFPTDYIKKLKDFLKKNYGIEPFLVAVKDKSKPFQLYSKFDFFSKPDEPTGLVFKKAFLDSIFHTISSDSYDKGGKSNRYFSMVLSLFSQLPFYSGKCDYFYSTKFGYQRSYHLYNVFNQSEGSHKEDISIYYICFNEIDIDQKQLLKRTLKSSNKKIKRQIVKSENKSSIKLPGFYEKNGRNYYLYDVPNNFYTLCRNMALFFPGTKELFLKNLEKSYLQVSLEVSEIKSVLRNYIKWLQISIYFCVLAFLILYLKTLTGINIFLSLSFKLKLAVAFIVFIPVFGFVFILEIINRNNYNLELHNSQNIVNSRIKLLEHIFESNDTRQMLIAQNFKKDFSDNWLEYFKNSRMVKPPFFPLKDIYKSIENFRVLNQNLETYIVNYFNRGYLGNYTKKRCDFLDLVGYYRIVKEMGLVNNGNLRLSAEIAKSDLMLASTGSFWNSVTNRRRLSSESLIDRPFSDIDTLRRGMFQLIGRAENPFTPEMLLAIRFRENLLDINALELLRTDLDSLSYTDSKIQVNFGIFLCGKSYMKPNPIKNVATYDRLYNFAYSAFKKKNTISDTVKNKDSTLIRKAIYKGNSPVIIVAEAIILRDDRFTAFFYSLALLLVIYCISAISLLSKALADLFLSPIKTLSEFVNCVEKGEINVKAEIDTGNELNELALSFNKMSEGLVEREKMRRFVSEKLYQSLYDKNEASSAEKVKVAILSSDIRNFTLISESNSPEEIVSLLNDYFTEMEEAIIENGGSIEKIIGDAIVAGFYKNSEFEENYCIRACKAALQMRNKLKQLNETRMAESKFTIENGIGISSGEVLLGYAGKKSRRREFILIGDAVKKAELLEAKTKNGVSSKIFIDLKVYESIKNIIPVCSYAPEQNTRELKND
ncbi:MAG: adenylate/guanylate cyclase domain-containing protein [Candidatus Riflebacteria bacterium]